MSAPGGYPDMLVWVIDALGLGTFVAGALAFAQWPSASLRRLRRFEVWARGRFDRLLIPRGIPRPWDWPRRPRLGAPTVPDLERGITDEQAAHIIWWVGGRRTLGELCKRTMRLDEAGPGGEETRLLVTRVDRACFDAGRSDREVTT